MRLELTFQSFFYVCGQTLNTHFPKNIFLVSYRDNYQDIYSISKDEIEQAKENNKKLFLGVETKSDEGDNVSFQEEGKKVMEEEFANIRGLIPSDFGVAIHYIKTWYNLKQ